MALVAYDYSSGSENEAEEENTGKSTLSLSSNTNDYQTTQNVNINNEEATTSQNIQDELIEPETPMFKKLPNTKTEAPIEIPEDKIEDFIPRPEKLTKPKAKVKITIPSLAEFQDLDEPVQKKVKLSSKSSGLLSLLPPVQGTPLTNKSFVPNVLKQKSKPATATSTTSLVPNAVKRKAELKKLAAIEKLTKTQSASDAESDDDMELPETFDDEMWEKVCGRPKKKEIIRMPEEQPPQEINIAPEPVKPYEGLDNEAFKELVGKNRRPIGNIKMIDINEEEILPERDVWMTKALTDPEVAPKKEVEDPVDPTRRKKHHITYLAQQAKANEQELQNQWSSSKYNRNQTRAKYGF